MSPPLPPAFLAAPIAHRAFHDRAAGRPENSRAAIAAAIDRGYGIEIDLQLSSDGVAMVFHDEALERLTGHQGLISDLPAERLGRITLSGGQEGIPTFAEVLALVAGRAALLIELKDQTGCMGPTDGRLEAATVAALAGYAGPVALMSFNPHSVALLAALAPHLPRGLTTAAWDPADWAPVPPARCDELCAIPDYDRCDASFLSHEAADLGRPRVAELARQGAAILCWTIRSQADEDKARRIAANVTFEGYRPAPRP
ncbi:glycerophosphodiester phosphodiesterase family protein [Szabonella alba]|uniref:Phosphodiesterase n=1 Tax=Szabonella alba TaxID=2804194 RepID=A0A8K0XYP1_9RHOB|nr:glycerophosphodiester phosphodiesterase family protein [Szabonella alba]MBL4915946.1 phosphodiesterase [Szabonella alba]